MQKIYLFYQNYKSKKKTFKKQSSPASVFVSFIEIMEQVYRLKCLILISF